MFFLPAGQQFLTGGRLPQAYDGRFGERPREMGRAECGPGGSGALSGRCLGTRHETTRRSDLLHPRAALEVMDGVEPHAAETLAHAGDWAQQLPGMGVMVRGGADEGACEVTTSRIVVADAGAIDCKALLPRCIGNACRDAVAGGFVGDLLAGRRPVIVAVSLWHVRQAFAACACQGRASAPQVAGGAPLARRDRRLREHPAAPQPGDFLGVDRVVCGRAAMEGLHRKGMAADKRDALVSTEVSQPVPGTPPFGRHDDRSAVGGDRLEKRFGGRVQVTVQPRFTGVVEEANIHGAGGSIDATVIGVLCGVESP